ncbi:UNVERIFIED_CONTAM: hypothetical protein Slati_0924300 [Sesamum latifolium]|uniref:Aminotransferase-like plant mobile domain-containing protein n=1 Tax=Sesamum latifolium TaxID=2727402 RepID=A0AAW2XSY3_9LAMI
MASMMASGRRVILAIPVLVSIYEGLRSPKMTRFSGEGGVKYYDPQEARKRIHKAELVSGACNMIVKNKPFKFIDNGDAEELDHDYFIAIHSSYLTLRQGDKFIIESYSPHRFGRQFRYFQDVPGILKYDTRAASLEEGLRYWRLCILSKSSSKVWFPGRPTNAKKLCSEAYKAWWARVHGTFFDDNIACLISPKPTKIIIKRKKHEDEQVGGGENNPPHVPIPSIVVKSNSQAVAVELEDEVQSIDTNEESETSHSWTTTPPIGMGLKGKQLSRPPAVSVFEEIVRSPREQHLKGANNRLQDVQAKASEGASKVQSIMNELEHIEKEIIALKGQRTSLCVALKGQKQLNHDI